MSKLLKAEPKNRTYGFIIIDKDTRAPLAVTSAGVLLPAKEPSFFRITPRNHAPETTTRHRTIDYAFARKKAQKVIDRHFRSVAKIHQSSLFRQWTRLTQAKTLNPVIQPVKTNPSV